MNLSKSYLRYHNSERDFLEDASPHPYGEIGAAAEVAAEGVGAAGKAVVSSCVSLEM